MNGKREYDLRDQERREQAANVRVGALCRVEKFDPAAMRVDVQPLSKALDAGVYRTQPQILSVPVALVRGGGFVLRPCYKAGDVGVLLYIDHDIDRIAASGEESEPNTERNHSDEDAVFIGAFVPASNPLSGLPDNGSTTSTSGAFTMNTSSTNSGGWGSSQMRSKVLGSASSPTSPTANTLLAALPSDLRAVMKSCTKYTDNKGGGNTASNVSSTTDYLFLLSEYEVFATHQYCNDAEPNYQAQYDYFKAGNSKVANKHSATGTAAVWWLRSPYYYSTTPPSARFRRRGRWPLTTLAMRMVLCPAL